MKKTPLPNRLAVLPVMAFSRKPAPSAADQKRSDIAYGIKSSDSLLRAFDRREAQIVHSAKRF